MMMGLKVRQTLKSIYRFAAVRYWIWGLWKYNTENPFQTIKDILNRRCLKIRRKEIIELSTTTQEPTLPKCLHKQNI